MSISGMLINIELAIRLQGEREERQHGQIDRLQFCPNVDSMWF